MLLIKLQWGVGGSFWEYQRGRSTRGVPTAAISGHQDPMQGTFLQVAIDNIRFYAAQGFTHTLQSRKVGRSGGR